MIVGSDYNTLLGLTFNQQALFYSKCVFGADNMVSLTANIANKMNASASSTAGLGFF